MSVCDECGQEIELNLADKFVAHTREDKTPCPNSGLRALDVPYVGPWEVNGGLPTLGKGHR